MLTIGLTGGIGAGKSEVARILGRLGAAVIYADALGQPGTKDETQQMEWELFDLEKDPCEMCSVYDNPTYADTVTALKAELRRLQQEVGDEPYPGG